MGWGMDYPYMDLAILPHDPGNSEEMDKFHLAVISDVL